MVWTRTPFSAASRPTSRASIRAEVSRPSDSSTTTRALLGSASTRFSASPSPSAMAVERPVIPISAASMARATAGRSWVRGAAT